MSSSQNISHLCTTTTTTTNGAQPVSQWLPWVVIYGALAIFSPLLLRTIVTVLTKLLANEKEATWQVLSGYLRKQLRSIVSILLVTLFTWYAIRSLPWPACRVNEDDDEYVIYGGVFIFVNFIFQGLISAIILLLVSRVFDVVSRMVLEMHALIPNPTIRLSFAQGINAVRVVIIVLVGFALLGWTLTTLDDTFAMFLTMPFTPNVVSVSVALLLLVPAAKHMIGGLVVLIDSPFNVGDVIQVAGRVGTVTNIGLFTFTLQEVVYNHINHPPPTTITEAPVHNIPSGCAVTEPILNFSTRLIRPMEIILPVIIPNGKNYYQPSLMTKTFTLEEKKLLSQRIELAAIALLPPATTATTTLTTTSSNTTTPNNSVLVSFIDPGILFRSSKTGEMISIHQPCLVIQIQTTQIHEIQYDDVKMRLILELRMELMNLLVSPGS
jgi:hypothetical protein